MQLHHKLYHETNVIQGTRKILRKNFLNTNFVKSVPAEINCTAVLTLVILSLFALETALQSMGWMLINYGVTEVCMDSLCAGINY